MSARIVDERSLPGVHSGSALLAIGSRLLAIHDDAFRLSWIELPGFAVRPVVIAGDGAALPKAAKPDFEAAVYAKISRSVYLIGSGSTKARCKIARLELDAGVVTIAERAWPNLATEHRGRAARRRPARTVPPRRRRSRERVRGVARRCAPRVHSSPTCSAAGDFARDTRRRTA